MKKDTQQAFVLFYTIIIIGAILSSTSIMLTIYIKNLKLGNISRESVVAYSAAETGAECAFFWYLNGAVFEPSSDVQWLHDHDNSTTTAPNPVDAFCNTVQLTTNGAGVFTVYLVAAGGAGDSSGPCAEVEVIHGVPTQIHSRGFNTCNPSAVQVERGYDIFY